MKVTWYAVTWIALLICFRVFGVLLIVHGAWMIHPGLAFIFVGAIPIYLTNK